MKPLTRLEIRDLNVEIEDHLKHLKFLESFGIVHSFKGRSLEEALKRKKVYGLGFSIKDIMTYLNTRLWNGLIAPYTGAGFNETFTFKEIGGTVKTLAAYYTTTNVFNASGSAYGSQLGFGNPASPPTPTRDDYQLVSPVARFNPSTRIYSETDMKTTLTGSYVWAAGGTIREIGQYVLWRETGGVVNTFLMYHDAVSDTVCPAGGTVAVTYVTQY